MRNNTVRSQKGFTLIEIMITVAILGVIASIAPDMFVKFYDFFFLSEARTVIQRDTRAALDLMNRNLRQATETSITIDSATGQPPYSRVRFTKYGETTQRAYYQQGSQLMETAGTATKKVCDNLRYLSFTFPKSDDLGIISVSMTLEKIASKGQRKAIHVAIEKVRVMNE